MPPCAEHGIASRPPETQNSITMKRLLALALALALSTVGSVFGALAPIELPAPQKTGGMPLMEALAKRASSRDYDLQRELSPQQLSNLLWATNGINREDGRRTAPSASNRQDIEIYALTKDGAFIYDAKTHKLLPVAEGDMRDLGGTQEFAKGVPLTLVLIADLSKQNGDETARKLTAQIDAGYVSQNIYLFCASEGLVTRARGSMDRTAIVTRLGLRQDQSITVGHCVAFPKVKSP